MVLVVLTNTRDVAHNWDFQLLQDLRVAYSGTFKNLWCAKRTSCDNHKLSCLDGIMDRLAQGKAGLCLFIRFVLNTNRTRGL